MFESPPAAASLDFPSSQKQRPTYPVVFFPPPLSRQIVSQEPACATPQRPHLPSHTLPARPVQAVQRGMRARSRRGGWEGVEERGSKKNHHNARLLIYLHALIF